MNELILQIKALEYLLTQLYTQFVGLNVLESEPLQSKIEDMLRLQKTLKEEYSVDYSSSLLNNFDYFSEVNTDAKNEN